jgi:hypothetical protein
MVTLLPKLFPGHFFFSRPYGLFLFPVAYHFCYSNYIFAKQNDIIKPMKEILKIQYKSSLAAFLMLVMIFPACELDDIDPDGDIRDKFIGTWRFDESEAKSDLTFYTVQITKDPGNTSQVLLRNFGNVGNASAYGIVTTNRITVTSQTLASLTISGSGSTVTNTRMNWTYSIIDGADLINFTAVADKQ